jgi:heterodisulfide reductase subunit B
MSATIGYYPGCSLSGTAKEYDRSLRAVCAALGVELREIEDWSCCGASSAHATNHLLSVALPARNLALAAQQRLGEVMAPCAACYNRLVVAQQAVAADAALRGKVEFAIEQPLGDGVAVLNIVQFLQRIGAEAIAARTTAPLKGLKAACYYGCLLVRPASVTGFDDAERPTSMEDMVRATGAVAVEWNYKTECCGASHSFAHKDIVVDLSRKIIDDARAHGADVVVVACPMCHSNLDMRQLAMRNRARGVGDIPILYLSELLGLAFGIGREELGLTLHFIDPAPAIDKARAEVTA